MDRGIVHRTRFFNLFCHVLPQPGPTQGPPLVGIFASRRVGGAVQRNRARRRIREAYRRFRPLIIVEGARLVFQSRQPAVDCPFPELVAGMRRVLEESGVMSRQESPSIEP